MMETVEVRGETFVCPISGMVVRSGFLLGNLTNAVVRNSRVRPKCGHTHRLDSPRGVDHWIVDGVEK